MQSFTNPRNGVQTSFCGRGDACDSAERAAFSNLEHPVTESWITATVSGFERVTMKPALPSDHWPAEETRCKADRAAMWRRLVLWTRHGERIIVCGRELIAHTAMTLLTNPSVQSASPRAFETRRRRSRRVL